MFLREVFVPSRMSHLPEPSIETRRRIVASTGDAGLLGKLDVRPLEAEHLLRPGAAERREDEVVLEARPRRRLEETRELVEGEGELLLALGHRRRVGVAGDVERDQVLLGGPLERGARDLMDVAGGALPDAFCFHVGIEVVEVLGGELRELYPAYAGDQVVAYQRRVLLVRGPGDGFFQGTG